MTAPAHDTVPRRVCDLLADLIDTCGRVLAKPHIAFGEAGHVAALGAEIARAIARPAEDVRLIDDAAAMLARALAELAGPRRDAGVTEKWRAIAQALEPLVRRDRDRACEIELKLAMQTTDQERGR